MIPATRTHGRPARWKPALVAVILFCVYTANGRESGAGDTVPALLLPISILRGDGATLDRFAGLWPVRLPYFVVRAQDRLVSGYPVAAALLATPLVAPQLAWLDARDPGWETREPLEAARRMGKRAAALLGALGGAALFALLCRVAPEPCAWLATAGAALGSNLWATASQSAWQHGPSALALTLAIALLLRAGPSRARLCAAGLACALLVALRPQNFVFALAVFAFVVWRERGRTLWFVPFPVLVGAALALWNLSWFGSPLGGYAGMLGLLPAYHGVAGYASSDPLGGLAGTLASPSRGLFVFTPWVLIALASCAGWRERLRDFPIVGALLLALIPFLAQLSFQAVWWGGHSFGPRYWTDVMPLFAITLAWALEWSLRRSRAVFGLLLASLAFSIGVQAIGAFCYPSSWNMNPGNIDVRHERFWDWRDNDLRRCLTECIRDGIRRP